VKTSIDKHYVDHQTAKKMYNFLGGSVKRPRKLHITWQFSRTSKEISRLLGGLAELPRKLHVSLVA
jgi:hypothetical protein